MKKLIIMLILPMFIFLTINIYLSSIYFDYAKSKSIYYSNTLIDLKSNEPLDFVNIGSSHGERAFIYPEEFVSINFGMDGQDLEYGIKLLNTVKHRFNNNTVIIIPLSYFHFGSIYGGNSSRYANFLPLNKIDNITYEEYLIKKYFPLVGFENFSKLISKANQNNYDIIHQTLDLEEWYEESKLTVNSQIATMEGDYVQYNLELLQNFIDENKNLKIVLINTPYYQSYNDNISVYHDLLNIYYYNLIDILTKSSNIYFLDYSRDIRFQSNIQFFLDDDHLNYEGAKIFTKLLLYDINDVFIE